MKRLMNFDIRAVEIQRRVSREMRATHERTHHETRRTGKNLSRTQAPKVTVTRPSKTRATGGSREIPSHEKKTPRERER